MAELGPVTVTPDLGLDSTCYLCGKYVDLSTTVYPDGHEEGERWVLDHAQLFHRGCWDAFEKLGRERAGA